MLTPPASTSLPAYVLKTKLTAPMLSSQNGNSQQIRTISITNDDGSQTKESYNLRGLTSVNEIIVWSSFCEDCFQQKKPHPPPAEYFARHYYNDPSRDFTLIRVLETVTTSNPSSSTIVNSASITSDAESQPQPTIASSVRIFKRLISTGGIGPSLTAGGIGEVCTSPKYRRRGLTTLLLQDAIEIMDSPQQPEMECTLLHASPVFVPFYQKNADYVSVTSRWSVLTIDSHQLFSSSDSSEDDAHHHHHSHLSPAIRLAQFPNDTPKLQAIHKKYSEDRFIGCIIRSERYWNEYISREIGDSLFVMTIRGSGDGEGEDDEETSTIIIGWISIRERDGHYQLRDFGLDSDLSTQSGLNTAYVMSRLLKAALEKQRSIRQSNEGLPAEADVDRDEILKLHLPNSIIEELQTPDCKDDDNWIDWTGGIVSKNDEGWMYRFFTKNFKPHADNMAQFIEHHKRDHIIWPSDSF